MHPHSIRRKIQQAARRRKKVRNGVARHLQGSGSKGNAENTTGEINRGSITGNERIRSTKSDLLTNWRTLIGGLLMSIGQVITLTKGLELYGPILSAIGALILGLTATDSTTTEKIKSLVSNQVKMLYHQTKNPNKEAD